MFTDEDCSCFGRDPVDYLVWVLELRKLLNAVYGQQDLYPA